MKTQFSQIIKDKINKEQKAQEIILVRQKSFSFQVDYPKSKENRLQYLNKGREIVQENFVLSTSERELHFNFS